MLLLSVLAFFLFISIHVAKHLSHNVFHSFILPSRWKSSQGDFCKKLRPLQTISPGDTASLPSVARISLNLDRLNSSESFVRRMTELSKRSVTRAMFSDSDLETIGSLILQHQAQLPEAFDRLTFALMFMRFSKKDFSDEVNNCLLTISTAAALTYPSLYYKYVNWLSEMKYKLGSQQLKVIENGLLSKLSVKLDKLICNLGHLKVWWSSLSKEATDSLQHKLKSDIPLMNSAQFSKLWIGLRMMQVTYDTLTIAREAVIDAVEKYLITPYFQNEKFLDQMGGFEYSFAKMSIRLQVVIDKLIRESMKKGGLYVLDNLVGLKIAESMSTDLKTYLCNEIPGYLVRSTQHLSRIVLLNDLNIEWKDISEAKKAMIFSAIVHYLPKFIDEERYSVIQGLLGVKVNYQLLPSILQSEIQNYIMNELIQHSTSNSKTIANINRLVMMNITYDTMNEKLKLTIKNVLQDRLSTFSNVEVLSIVSALERLGIEM